jgi:hypothetical protein
VSHVPIFIPEFAYTPSLLPFPAVIMSKTAYELTYEVGDAKDSGAFEAWVSEQAVGNSTGCRFCTLNGAENPTYVVYYEGKQSGGDGEGCSVEFCVTREVSSVVRYVKAKAKADQPITEEGQVVYEVTLSVKSAVFAVFSEWLIEHVNEMVVIEGFLSGQVAESEDKAEKDAHGNVAKHVVIARYVLEDQDAMDNYLTNHADRMRGMWDSAMENAPEWKGAFSASRRIMTTITFL